MILIHIILLIISFFLGHCKNALKNLAIVWLLFHRLNIISIIRRLRSRLVVITYYTGMCWLAGYLTLTLHSVAVRGPSLRYEAKIKSVRAVSEQILGQQLRVNPDNLGAAALSQNPSFSSCFSFSSSVLLFHSPPPPLHWLRPPQAVFLPILAPILLPALPAVAQDGLRLQSPQSQPTATIKYLKYLEVS